MAISCCRNTASQIRNKIPEVHFSKIAAKIGSGLEKYITFPAKAVNCVTAPFGRKMVNVAYNLTGERYQRYCQTRAFSLAGKAMENLPELKNLAKFPQAAETPVSGCVEKSRKALRNLGESISSAAASMDNKAEVLADSKWMGVRALGQGVRFLSYPVEAVSYVPAGLSQVGEKIKDIPWAARSENEAQRVIADKIFVPLIKNIDRAVSAKTVQMGANLTIGCLFAQAIPQGYSSIKTILSGEMAPNPVYNNLLDAGRANAYAWIGAPIAMKAVDAYRSKDSQISALIEQIVEKNPRLTESLSTINGLALTPEESKALLVSLVGSVLVSYEAKLGWLNLSDAKTIETLCSFPPVNLPVAAPVVAETVAGSETVVAKEKVAL